MAKRAGAIWEWKIVRRALWDALLKLNPRTMMGNPVMFVVEIGSVVTTALLFKGGADFRFNLQITLWLWFTVLFANFAEAMAEGRGKAQADTLRKARSETTANRLVDGGVRVEKVPSSNLRTGDIVLVSASEFIPSDGEIIEGVASVDESAITGESLGYLIGRRYGRGFVRHIPLVDDRGTATGIIAAVDLFHHVLAPG